jgi:hypothetical protein
MPAPADVLAAWGGWLEAQRRDPRIAVLFRLLPDVELRRQVLRWTAREADVPIAAAERLARTALRDEDPEVRVTAMLFAARRGLRALARDVRDAPVPESTADGAPPGDRLYFRRIRRLCAGQLALPPDAPLDDAARARQARFETALRGDAEVRDDETLLWHALATPLGLEDLQRGGSGSGSGSGLGSGSGSGSGSEEGKREGERADARGRDGVAGDEDDLLLPIGEGGIPLRRVGAVRHWLGGLVGPASGAPPLPVRAARPSAAFLVSTRCIDNALAARLLGEAPPDEADHPVAASGPAAPWSGDAATAARLVERLAAATGRSVRLPTADEREMAARGPDGRFFPWGVTVRPPAAQRELHSPWGLVVDAPGAGAGVGVGAEWAVEDDGTFWIVGDGPCARRRPARPGYRAAVRVMVPGDSAS